MRIRKLGAMFCVMCILAGCFILYVVMDLGFSQEKTKPAPDLEYVTTYLNHDYDIISWFILVREIMPDLVF